jgi:hypothetical protein
MKTHNLHCLPKFQLQLIKSDSSLSTMTIQGGSQTCGQDYCYLVRCIQKKHVGLLFENIDGSLPSKLPRDTILHLGQFVPLTLDLVHANW